MSWWENGDCADRRGEGKTRGECDLKVERGVFFYGEGGEEY